MKKAARLIPIGGTMADWCRANQISASAGVVSAFDPSAWVRLAHRCAVCNATTDLPQPDGYLTTIPISSQGLPGLIVASLREAFPQQTEIIDKLASTHFAERRPVDGTTINALDEADCFGRALEETVAEYVPVARLSAAVCGQIARYLLIRHVRSSAPESGLTLEKPGATPDCCLSARNTLEKALLSPGAHAYTPDCELPLARCVARLACQVLPSEILWWAFTGHLSYIDLMLPANHFRRLGLYVNARVANGYGDLTPNRLIADFERSRFPAAYPLTTSAPDGVRDTDLAYAAGCAVWLLANSPYHCQYPMDAYLHYEVRPAFAHGQFRLYVLPDGSPRGLVTWAWLSGNAEADVHATGRVLHAEDWTGGDRLFFNDWITERDAFRPAVQEMTQVIFPNEVASSLRRAPNGSVRKINRWTGANLRSETHSAGSPERA
jgi:cytolysin-activating lysine-acyltransferase